MLGGTKCLVVTDQGVIHTGLAVPIVNSLKEAGIDVVMFDKVLPNPPDYTCMEAAGLLLVTENGLGAYDKLEDGKVHDPYRIQYLREHITQIQEAITDGAEIRTLQRYRKDSFYWYKKVIETNGADLTN